jgi:isoamylase
MGRPLLRGLDNATYYRLLPTIRATASTTPALRQLPQHVASARVLQMVADSLRYWAQSFRVDGFRFDLGVTLGREGARASRRARPSSTCCARTRCWVAAEADLRALGHRPRRLPAGQHPPSFAEWNDKFRDTPAASGAATRASGGLAARLSGSGDLFDHRARGPGPASTC